MGKHHKRNPFHNSAALVAVGSLAAAALAVTPGSASALTTTAAAGIDWAPLIQCESGGNPRAQNPGSTASGAYQFLDSSWLLYGGGRFSARAMDATFAQQTEIANAAYARSGLSPWAASQACWAGKITVGATARAQIEAATPAPVVPPKVSGAHASGLEAPAGAASGTPRHAAVTVVAGDTLSQIAVDHGQDWPSVYAANQAVVGTSPDLIFPGQVLVL